MIALRLKHLKIFSALLIALAVVLSPAIQDITYRSEITDYFRNDAPAVQAFHKLESDLGLQQSLLILIEMKQQSVLNPEGINTLFTVSQRIRKLSGVAKTNSLLSTAISDAEQNTFSMYRYFFCCKKR